MADKDSKKDSSSESGGGGGDAFSDVLFWILLPIVFIYSLGKIFDFYGLSFAFLPSITQLVSGFFGVFQVFSIFLSLLFFIGIVYFNIKLGDLMHHHGHEGHGTHHEEHFTPEHRAPNKRWQNVIQRLNSRQESDWRLSVIECDIILGDMLKKMGYQGEGVAEMLKNVEPSDFQTLDKAWEAHKVRNNIAHKGSEYTVSQQEADRVVNLYKEVFEEFYFI